MVQEEDRKSNAEAKEEESSGNIEDGKSKKRKGKNKPKKKKKKNSKVRTKDAIFVCHFLNMEQMENQQKGNENEQASNSPSKAGGFGGLIYEQYRKGKENAEAYPYVWASYLLVYGGFGLWVAYRYRMLRKTEDRVRVLQDKLRKLHQERQSGSSAAVTQNVPSSFDKATK